TIGYREAANEYALLNKESAFGYIQKADWFKIRDISLSYNFTNVIRRLGAESYIRKLNVGASVHNLLNYSLYEGPDPEVNMTGSRAIARGRDFTSLQQPRTYNLTVSLGF